MINVLVFPCGSEVGLEICNALKYTKDINLFGASSADDHGKYVFRNYIGNIPFITDDNFIESIESVIKKNNIDMIYPAMDSVALKLIENQYKLSATVVVSKLETCQICSSKRKTYELFDGEWFNPIMYKNTDEVTEFPVFLKPDVGYGSKGIEIIHSREKLEQSTNSNKDLLILEYLPNEEYTVDCFTDNSGKLLFAGMRERKRIRNGISVNSSNLPLDNKIEEIAEIVNSKMEFNGAWFFQVKRNKSGEFRLLEIATRIAGTMCLYRNKGINFPVLSIYNKMGFNLEINPNDFEITVDRALINRYKLDYKYERVYIDFDDTITIGDKVNPFVMSYIYQCLYKDIELILITRHINNIYDTLKKLKIDKSIFGKIIHLDRKSKKSSYMNKDKKSIFIDDSFRERNDVKMVHNMPVFDIDSIECLIDYKNYNAKV